MAFARPAHRFGEDVHFARNERSVALRRAFMAALQDKEAVAEAAKMNLDLDPLSGEEVQAEVAKAYATPARIVERAKQALVYRAR